MSGSEIGEAREMDARVSQEGPFPVQLHLEDINLLTIFGFT